MADHAEQLLPLGLDVPYRQAIMPKHQSGSFIADDTDNHDYRFSSRGKSNVAFSIDNPANQTLTWTLYGMHEADGEVGDEGTFELDTDSILTADKASELFAGYPYPYYLLRCAFAVAPDDDPLKTVSVYVDIAN